MMDYVKIVFISLFSLLVLFLLTKLNGNRQVSELTMFDYIIGISIGSIAAEMATELEKPTKPLLAMIIYGLVAWIVSIITEKSVTLRRFILGKSIILIKNGKILKNNFKSAHLDLNEFTMQCRTQGWFDISAIRTAVIEPNGKISVLPYPEKRPVTAEDLKAVPSPDAFCYAVISDGNILEENLKIAGYDKNKLENELKSQGKKDIKKIFYATLDENGKLTVFDTSDKCDKNDPFI